MTDEWEAGAEPAPESPPAASAPRTITRPAPVLVRAFGATVLTLSVLAAIALGAVLLYTSTDWGRERVRRFAESRLQAMVNGQVQIGQLTGGVLTGVTVHDLVIRDSAGQPFLAVSAIRGSYGVWDLLHRRIWIHDAVIVRPFVVLDRPPDGTWNWRRIFIRDTTHTSHQRGWGDWIRLTNVDVVEGNLVVRTPWHPSRTLHSAAARDSAVRATLSGESRLVIAQVPGGFQKTVQLRSVTAKIPLLRLADPDYQNRLMRVSALEMQAFPFSAPWAEVVDLKGVFPFNDDSIWWAGVQTKMPHTLATGRGSYVFKTGDMTIAASTGPSSSADFRWVYPRLPSNGSGSFDFRLTWRGPVEDYLATNIDFALQGSHVAGRIGVWRGDTVRIHDTDLRFAGVDTRLIEQLVPDFTSPRRGTLSGRAAVAGGRNALTVNGDVSFSDARGAGTSRVIAQGEVGFPAHGIRARDLALRLEPLQIELLRTFAPTLPISGVVTGAARVNGSTASALRIVADLDHRDRGTVSAVSGTLALSDLGRVSRGWDGIHFDADLRAHPVSLVEVGRFFPSVGLQGTATGPVRLRGTLANMEVHTDVRLPDGGQFAANGTVALAGAAKRYDLAAGLQTFNLRTVLARGPQTDVTALTVIRGVGTDPATMTATIAADVSTSRWDSVAVDTASVRASISGGLVHVARLDARGAHTAASVSGTFGLTGDRSGTLDYRIAVDSLGAYNRWIPGADVTATGGMVPPRPGLVSRAMQAARAESLRVAKRTEVERFVTGRPPPTLKVQLPRTVPRDSIGGVLYAAGTVSGNLHDFDLRGRAGGEDLTVRGNFVHRFSTEYAWTDARTPASRAVVGVDADSVMAFGFALDTVSARVTYASHAGHAELLVRQGDTHDYGLVGDFTLDAAGNEVRIADLRARLDTALWHAPHPSAIRWGGPGIEVVNFELVNRGTGRIFANGLLPTQGVANFGLSMVDLPVGDVLDLLQSDVDLRGAITLSGRMSGNLSDPSFSGAFSLLNGLYRGDTMPHLRGTFGYANAELSTHVDAFRRAGTPIAAIDARLPLNLALSGVPAGTSRLLDREMTVDLVADSLPLELIPDFTDLVSNTHGLAAGRLALRGRLKRPSLSGGLVISNGAVTINETGQTIERLNGTVRMQHDTVFLGDRPATAGAVEGQPGAITGISQDTVRLRGTIAVGNWREPVLDLHLWGNRAEVLNNKWGRLRAIVGLAITGPLSSAYVSGGITVIDGVIRAPEPTGRKVIGAGDRGIFAVLDTSIKSDLELFPRHAALLENMRVEVTVDIHRNTWVRNSDANVEIYTDYPLMVSVSHAQLALTGVVTTDRGEYSVLSKRFQIQRGSAMFIGTTDLNPTLQVTGEYQVKLPTTAAIGIKVLIGGTLKHPSLALESDVQPPRTTAELMSLLAFGQSSTSLLSLEGSSIAALGSGADLVGLGAGLAVRRLAGVALGVAVDEVESEAGRALGTDYLNITPADVPTELWQGRGLSNFFTQTSVELGKYLNPRTFLGVKTVGINPGVSIQYRTPKGWRYEATMAPRILVTEPSLSLQTTRTRQGFAAFIIREWRF